MPNLLRLHTNNLAAPSLSTSFKVDEGYSDETKSQSDRESKPSTEDVITLPDWLLTHSEADRAELAYGLLRSLRTSTVATVVERLTPLLHMDPVLKLPPEITSEIFSHLDPQTLLTASLASRAWRSRIQDSHLWRKLYTREGWRVDVAAIRRFEQERSELHQSRKSKTRCPDLDIVEPKLKKRVPSGWLNTRTAVRGTDGEPSLETDTLLLPDNEGDCHMIDAMNEDVPSHFTQGQQSSPFSGRQSSSSESTFSGSSSAPSSAASPHSVKTSLVTRQPNGSVKVNWQHLYKQRRRLEENWMQGRFTNFQLPHPSHPEEAHRECVYAIQFSGKWLVSGSRDKTIRVWDLDTKRLWYRPLVGHSKSVLCLQFDPSPSEDIIVSGSSDKNVIIWKFSTGEKIHEIHSAHEDSVLNLRFDHRYIVTCSKDNLIKIWNRHELTATDENYPRVYQGSGVTYPAYIVDIASIPSPVLEAEIANGHIQSVAPYSLLMTIDGHGAAVNAIQMNGDEVVSASGDRLIKVWNVRDGSCKKTLIGHEKGIACVQFDNRRILSGSNDNTVRIYDHISGAEVACLYGHHKLVRTVQAGFGDPPGADEELRMEALEVDNKFWDAKRSGAAVDLGPRALRRAGQSQDTAGSRNPKDIKALGAAIPPGGGGTRWGRIVSGSYDETIIIWKKDREGKWVIGHTLHQVDAVTNASQQHPRVLTARELPPRNVAPPQQTQQIQALQGHMMLAAALQNQPAQAAGPMQAANRPAFAQLAAHHHHHGRLPFNRAFILPTPQPTSRVFKLQFDARKIICASQDPRIVVWDFACDDEEITEASQFFVGL